MPDKLHRCVQHVMGKGHTESEAYAICNASIGKMAEGMTDDELDAALQLEAERLRVVDRRSDGSGVIEIPVAVPALLDLSKTAGGQKKTFDMNGSVFDQVVANFSIRPGPKAVYPGHISQAARRTTPAWGFIEAVWVENGKLWNRIDLNAEAFDAIVTRRGFRSASIEMDLNYEAPTGGVVSGWSQGALAITNTPALDVQYVAAEATTSETVSVSTGIDFAPAAGREKEKHMADITLESLQADKLQLEAALKAKDHKIAEQAQIIATTQSALNEATAERDAVRLEKAQLQIALNDKASAVTQLTSQVEALTGERDAAVKKAATLEKASLSTRVRNVIATAIKNGVDASYFEGSEGNEAAWLGQRFANPEALETFVAALPKRKGATTLSGNAPTNDDVDVIPADQAAALRRRGLDPRFALVHTSDDLHAIRAAKKE